MKLAISFALAVFSLSACKMKDSAATDTSATAAVDSVAAPAPTVVDSMPGPAVVDSTIRGGTRTTPKVSKPADGTIGRDSAHGPIATIDEKGNVTPIRKDSTRK
jgi:hypothetical protein